MVSESKFKVYFVVIVIVSVFIVWLVQVNSITQANILSEVYSGVFYNSGAEAGGSVTGLYEVSTNQVTGFMNFTERPEDPTPLCGAGDLTATRSGNEVIGQLTSNDPDSGCGFDMNGILSITGTLGMDDAHFYGDYETRNAGGSSWDESLGEPKVFELWQDEDLPETWHYVGTFENTNVNRGGPVTIDIIVGTKTVSGYINYTNLPSEGALCGAGFFTGMILDNSEIEFSFVSNDPDLGCGFDDGLRFLQNATLTPTAISGIYGFSSSSIGNFNAGRVQKLYIPIVIR